MAKSNRSMDVDAELLVTIRILTDEVKVLREVVDELRMEVQWGNHNEAGGSRRLTGRTVQSCSLDPTSPDFSVNSVGQESVERMRAELPPLDMGNCKQRNLFT